LPNCGYDALSEFRWSEGRWMYQADRKRPMPISAMFDLLMSSGTATR
jgi:hypothetical protein